jgi:hypothetical protein
MTAFTRIAVLAACLATCAAPAMAATNVATFRAEVKGTQTTTWSENHTPQSQCDQGVSGSGRERVTFASTRPTTIVATRFGGHHILFGSADLASADIVTRATVSRQGSTTSTPLDIRCEGTGGGGTPPAPDCGARHGSLAVALAWSPAGREGIMLEQGDLGSLLHAYTNCPVIGTAFPQLLDLTTAGDSVVARMPASALFDRSIGKHIVIATGRRVSHSGDSTSTTTIRFTVSLTRVKGGGH